MLQLRTGNRLQRRRAKKHFPRLTATQVQNQAALMEALQSAVPGTVIELASGDYGDWIVNWTKVGLPQYNDYVTITSADGNRGAVFNSIDIRNTSYLRFDGIKVEKTVWDGAPDLAKDQNAFKVWSSHHVQVINCEISFSPDDDPTNDGYGLSIRGENVLIQNNLFHDLDRALGFGSTSYSDVKDNTFYDIRSDGMNFDNVTHVLIENNTGINWHPTYRHAHPDFIQFWTGTGTGPNSHVTIRRNVFIPGNDGDSSPQGIFIRDEGARGLDNFLIEQNFVMTNSKWGIRFEVNPLSPTAENVIVRNNTVISDHFYIWPEGTANPGTPGHANHAGIHVISGSGRVTTGDVSNNISATLQYDPNMTGSNNVIIQHTDPNLGNYYGNVFLNPFGMEYPASTPAAAMAFLPIPGGLLDGLGAQSRLEEFGVTTAWIQVATDDPVFAAKELTFHAAGSVPTGPNVTFEWDFGDGSAPATGRTVTHTFPDFDSYNVTLTITDPNTSLDYTTTKLVQPDDRIVASVAFDGQSAESVGKVAVTGVWENPDLESYVSRDDGFAAEFTGATGSQLIFIFPSGQFVGVSALTVSFDFKLSPGGTGRAVWNAGNVFGFQVGGGAVDGYFCTSDTGAAWIYSGPLSPSLDDGQWHTVTMTYDGAAEIVTTYLDEDELASRTFSGTTINNASSPGRVTIGGWSNKAFEGLVDNLRIIRGVVPPDDMAAFLAQYT